jgi:DNA invertase Pin-like site-specific DNA recombinase
MCDDGISGTKKSRPELDKLMRDATKGLRDFKSVVVWRLSRFGRSTQHLHALISDLREAGVGFISKQEGFDLNTPIGKMF